MKLTYKEQAEEFLIKKNYPLYNNFGGLGMYYVKEAMIEFAKMHVQEALRLASVEAEVEHELSNPYDPNSEYQIVNKDSILNAYPLENII